MTSKNQDTLVELDIINNFVLRRSSIIEASAGTGKTFNITYMVLRLLLGPKFKGDDTALDEPLNIENILVVTFTKAATAELSDRIREKIRKMRIIFAKLSQESIANSFLADELKESQLSSLVASYLDDNDANLLQKIVEEQRQSLNLNDKTQLSENGREICKLKSRILLKAERNIDIAAIRTIHSFCNSVINQIYAFEAGEPFNTELTDDIKEQIHKAYNEVIRQIFYRNKNADLLLENIGIPKESDIERHINTLNKSRILSKSKLKEPLYNFDNYALRIPLNDITTLGDDTFNYLLKKNISYEKKLNALIERFKSRQNELQVLIKDHLRNWHLRYSQSVDPSKAKINLDKSYSINKKPYEAICAIKNFDIENQNIEELYQAIKGAKLHELDGFMRKKAGALNDDEYEKSFVEFKESLKSLSKLVFDCFTPSSLTFYINVVITLMIFSRFNSICIDDQVMSNDEVLFKLAKALRNSKHGKTLAKAIRRRYRIAIIDEFQDTDPVQLDIFSNIYLEKEYVNSIKDKASVGCYCYIIGDPKQSIYSFRSADINSYISAKNRIREIAEPHNAIYSLKRNYRSAPDVIEGVNAIFSDKINPNNQNPFMVDKNDFSYVKAQGVSGKYAFMYDSDKEFLSSNFVNNVFLNKDEDANLAEALANACAFDILNCLKHGHLTKDVDKKNCLCDYKHSANITPDKIAILVSNASEFKCIQKALRKYNISCVYYSDKTSVLKEAALEYKASDRPSPEVVQIIYFMEAMLDSFNQNKVYRLLGSSLLKKSSQDFLNGISDSALEKEVSLLQDCLKLWDKWGFLTAFTHYFKDESHNLLPKFLSFENGERELTNYFHIAEIIQKSHTKIHGPTAQLRHFREIIEDEIPTSQASSLTQKRLESENLQIRVYTIHKSKGLEFPLVFMPFLWGNKKYDADMPCVYYDKYNKRMAYSFDKSIEENVKEALRQESVRLLYVALTRASAANFLYIGQKSDLKGDNSALTTLLGDPKGGVINALISLKYEKDGKEIPLFREVIKDLSLKSYEQNSDKLDESKYEVSSLFEKIKYNFVISSYSDIVSGLYGSSENQLNENENIYDSENDTDKRFIFPKGASAGTFLHEMMQYLAFENSLDDNYRLNFVKERLEGDFLGVSKQWELSFKDDPNLLDLQSENLSLWLLNIVKANLGKALNLNEDFYLSSLKKGEYIPEMEFLIPINSAHTYDDLNNLCIENAALEGISTQDMTLDSNKKNTPLYGFIKGSIDLVFCHKDKFYVVDYKSNYLGNDAMFYTRDAIGQNVFGHDHRYDMQYMLYSVALQKFLKSRLGDEYQYDKHFGGVLYLYLRGLYEDGPKGNYGIFATRPYEQTILDFEKIMED